MLVRLIFLQIAIMCVRSRINKLNAKGRFYMVDIDATLGMRGINFLPGCGGTINFVSLCACTIDVTCSAS